jgi:putative ABC transport system permease protein
MIKNYLRLAWRNLIKDRQFSILNILGLAIGLTCSLLIGLWVADELNMEHYNPNDARLYQVMSFHKTQSGIETGMYTPGILARTMKTDLPEVENATEVLPASWFDGIGNGGIVVNGEKKLKARAQYIDSNYFDVFACPWLGGDRKRLFADKQGVAISETFARAMFGTTQGLIGKVIHYDQNEFSGNFEIRGVFEPNPANATEHFDLLFNYAIALDVRKGLNEWVNADPSTFLLLKPGTDIARLNAKVRNFIHDRDGKDWDLSLFVARFSDRYLYDKYENGVQSGGRIAYVRLFSIIAVFILIIACINFMNLSTARAVHRAREVGIQKVVGAGRFNLVLQYLGESMLLSFLSLGLALVLVVALLPVFNEITGKELVLHVGSRMLFALLGITLVTGIIAGSYPAFYLSGFRPVAVLKGTIKTSLGELWARKGLVVFQFTLSVIFIAGVLIVYRQVNYIQSRDLGYNRDHVVHFSLPQSFDSTQLAKDWTFGRQLSNIPGVVSVGSYLHNLTGNHGEIGGVNWPGKDPKNQIDFANIEIGYHFLETIGIKLVAGRYFSENANTLHEIIFNETAIKAMGLKDPIGKTITFWDERRVIVGVAKDFNFESLYSTVKPAFFRCYPFSGEVAVRLRDGDEQRTITAIGKEYASFNPGMAFDWKFLDEDYQRLYASEIRIGILSRYFAGLAIFISCLGLFGLAAFTAQRRKKEIGIRKVVGASLPRVVLLLSREYLVLVLIAIGIAFPIAWLGMYRWLNEFAYRVSIRADIFLITGFAALAITLLTIGYQSIRAASANPVNALRSE